jgi:hypothetical protein
MIKHKLISEICPEKKIFLSRSRYMRMIYFYSLFNNKLTNTFSSFNQLDHIFKIFSLSLFILRLLKIVTQIYEQKYTLNDSMNKKF